MSLTVAVAGSDGRMGTEICRAIESAEGLALVGRYARGGPEIGQVLDECKPSVMVDVTHQDVATIHTLAALERGIAVVIGTSGVSRQDQDRIAGACNAGGAPCLLVPNFAIGAVLMMRFAAEAAKYMPDVEVIELHHEKKVDAPSGTAWRTAELIASARQGQRAESVQTGGAQGARGAAVEGVQVHSVRLPGFVGSQEVLFGSPGQRLSIRHDSIDRACFMEGVVMAVRGVRSLTGFHVGLDVLMNA